MLGCKSIESKGNLNENCIFLYPALKVITLVKNNSSLNEVLSYKIDCRFKHHVDKRPFSQFVNHYS